METQVFTAETIHLITTPFSNSYPASRYGTGHWHWTLPLGSNRPVVNLNPPMRGIEYPWACTCSMGITHEIDTTLGRTQPGKLIVPPHREW